MTAVTIIAIERHAYVLSKTILEGRRDAFFLPGFCWGCGGVGQARGALRVLLLVVVGVRVAIGRVVFRFRQGRGLGFFVQGLLKLPCLCCFAQVSMMYQSSLDAGLSNEGLNGMTDDRMFTVPEVARFFGITPQAVRQRIVEGRLQASKVRVKGIAREYRISGKAIQELLRPQ